MKSFWEKIGGSKSSTDLHNTISVSLCSEPGPSDSKLSKNSLWSGLFLPSFSIIETSTDSKTSGKQTPTKRSYGWISTVKRVMNGGSMRKIQERILGLSKTGNTVSNSDIWFLGVHYKISQGDPAHSDGLAAFTEDFSSRILITYRKGFAAIGDSRFTSDVNWGCMLRSSQMLVAQALLFHQLGRSWRKLLCEPFDKNYIKILNLFGDFEESPFSIHNLLKAGKAYNLAPGSWVGPYAMCRTWENLVRCTRIASELGDQSLPMAVYVVSGDEDGERGGAPVLCIEDASRHCLDFSGDQVDWTPILLLVPLVLGLDKLNPRYIPLLSATFSFPQSLGILGGKPGASTYLVGVQDGNAFYLDPHEVQPVVDIGKGNLEAELSSYHCNVIRHIPLDSIDPSLAIGFYCRDKDDFDNFCMRATELATQSNGAPLFTVAQSRNSRQPSGHCETFEESTVRVQEDSFASGLAANNIEADSTQEDEWQLL